MSIATFPLTSLAIVLSCSTTFATERSTVEDQISNRAGDGQATEFLAPTRTQQSFIAKTDWLDAVEVSLKAGNPGPRTVIRLSILAVTLAPSEDEIVSQTISVDPTFSGNLRFEFSTSAVLLTIGQSYWIRLSEEARALLWAFDDHNPFPLGQAWRSGQVMSPDHPGFRFRVYGHRVERPRYRTDVTSISTVAKLPGSWWRPAATTIGGTNSTGRMDPGWSSAPTAPPW